MKSIDDEMYEFVHKLTKVINTHRILVSIYETVSIYTCVCEICNLLGALLYMLLRQFISWSKIGVLNFDYYT
jgi:hypothetical protein